MFASCARWTARYTFRPTHPPTHPLTHPLTHSLLKVWAKQIDESLGQAEPHNRCASLRGLLQTEGASGIHKAGGVLADPSAAIALLWMRRSLQFLVHLLHELCEPGTSVAAAMRAAYDAHLEPYHGWVLKQARTCMHMHNAHAYGHAHAHANAHAQCTRGWVLAQAYEAACRATYYATYYVPATYCVSATYYEQAYQVALNSVPKRDEVLHKLFPRVQPSGRHAVFALEARECVVVLSRVVDAMRTLFEELDLEDVRKAPWI